MIAIYTRTNPAHAWKLERVTNKEAAELARDTNKNFEVSTLLVPVNGRAKMSEFLDANVPEE